MSRRVVVLCASPRRDGNSMAMASALQEGGRGAGHEVEIVELGATMGETLRDCRTCRRPDGTCSIEDDFASLVHDRVVPADAIVYATPLYWYGMSASLKNFFDRLTCYIAASYPRRDQVVPALLGKRMALLLASEERYPALGHGVTFQLQEIARYLRSPFVGVVNGIGNKRGEVRYDPNGPLDAARRLGAELFDLHHSDYWMQAERPNAVWPQARDTAFDAEATVYDDV
jgi:putative NADPH-quinone reductase